MVMMMGKCYFFCGLFHYFGFKTLVVVGDGGLADFFVEVLDYLVVWDKESE